jgi:hypothetical protein
LPPAPARQVRRPPRRSAGHKPVAPGPHPSPASGARGARRTCALSVTPSGESLGIQTWISAPPRCAALFDSAMLTLWIARESRAFVSASGSSVAMPTAADMSRWAAAARGLPRPIGRRAGARGWGRRGRAGPPSGRGQGWGRGWVAVRLYGHCPLPLLGAPHTRRHASLWQAVATPRFRAGPGTVGATADACAPRSTAATDPSASGAGEGAAP